MEETSTRFTLRLPKDLHDRISDSAISHKRSVNAEMVYLLGRGLEKDDDVLEKILSPNDIWRLKRFQVKEEIQTIEKAIGRLIKTALDEKETVADILGKLEDSYKNEKDLRILARDVIAAHDAIYSIQYGEDFIWFLGKNRESGAIDKEGKLYYSPEGDEWHCNMNYFKPYTDPEDEIFSGF